MGALLGAPASRLRGIYLALATLGFLQIVQIVIEEFADVTGGVRGLTVPKAALGGVRVSEYARFLIVLGCCALAIWTARNLLASRVGREFNAVRLSPHAAQALGVSVHRVRLTAFALSAAYAGLAGGLQAIVVGFIDPVEFGVSAALRQITFIVVGGMGSVGGSVVGAAVLSALPEALRPVKEYSDIIYTLILLGVPDLHAARARDAVARGAATNHPERPAVDGGGAPVTDRLAIESLSVRFGGVVAVRDLSLRVARGEIRGLIGPNGAGKTTVINAITGVVPIDAGVVRLDGDRVSGLPAHAISRRGIGRTFQHVEPFAELSVLDNVLVGVAATRTSASPLRRSPRRARADARTRRRARRSTSSSGSSFLRIATRRRPNYPSAC